MSPHLASWIVVAVAFAIAEMKAACLLRRGALETSVSVFSSVAAPARWRLIGADGRRPRHDERSPGRRS